MSGTILVLSVCFSEAPNHPATFAEINIPPQVFLCFIKTNIPILQSTSHMSFYAFSGNFFH